MKNLLVLTDFSPNANAAAEAGLLLAGKLHTDLLLFNTYIDYQTITSYGGGGWVVNEFSQRKLDSTKGLAALTDGLESLSDLLDPDDRRPAINSISDDTELGMDVAELIRQRNVEMVVMGARSDKPDDIAFGADTNTVIEHSTRPVLITPAKTDLRKIHRILFATDFEETDLKAIHHMARLAKSFRYKLEVVHVCDPDKRGCDEKEQSFRYHLGKLRYTGLYYHDIAGKDVVNRLNDFISDEPGTILAMIHVQNSFLVRLFQHSLVRKALVNQKTPLLIFPSKMDY